MMQKDITESSRFEAANYPDNAPSNQQNIFIEGYNSPPNSKSP
jgi:hypothetical protein